MLLEVSPSNSSVLKCMVHVLSRHATLAINVHTAIACLPHLHGYHAWVLVGVLALTQVCTHLDSHQLATVRSVHMLAE